MDKLIPDLSAAGALSGTNSYELWQGGPESVQGTLSDLSTFLGTGSSGFIPYTGASSNVDLNTKQLNGGDSVFKRLSLGTVSPILSSHIYIGADSTGAVNFESFLLETNIIPDVTGVWQGNALRANLAPGAAPTTMYFYTADIGTVGAGAVSGDVYGFVIGDLVSGLSGGSSSRGFYSSTNAASNVWNINFPGTAQNYINGKTGFGVNVPTEMVHVVGSIRMVDGNQGSGKVLTSDANGVASWQSAGGGSASLTSTQVGYGSGANVLTGSADFTYATASGLVLSRSISVNSVTASTSVTDTIITLSNNSSGTPANGYGSSKITKLKSTTTNDQDAASESVFWTNATHATRQSGYNLQLVGNANPGVLQDALSIRGNGNSFQFHFVNHVGYDPRVVLSKGNNGTYANIAMIETTGDDLSVSTNNSGTAKILLRPGIGSTMATFSATSAAFGSSSKMFYDDTNILLYVGGSTGAFGNTKIQAYDNVNAFSQINYMNINSGTSASTDYVATADTGTNTTNFVDMGINGSGFNDVTFTIVGALGSYLYSNGGNMAVGTSTANNLVFFTGGTLAANERFRVSSSFSSGAVNAFLFTPAANTGQTASTAIPGLLYSASTRQWATGAITTQKEISLLATTYSFVAASVITNAYGLYAEPAIAGTNATITNNWAAGFNGQVQVAGINKVTITQPTTSATLTLVTGSSLITAGAFALTLTSTATSNATIPSGTGTLAYLAGTNTWSGLQTFSNATGINVTNNVNVTAAGKGLTVKGGSNPRIGTATLVAGTVTVANTSVTANSRIFITPINNTSFGTLDVTIVAATSFTIRSTTPTDARVIHYFIVEET